MEQNSDHPVPNEEPESSLNHEPFPESHHESGSEVHADEQIEETNSFKDENDKFSSKSSICKDSDADEVVEHESIELKETAQGIIETSIC